jgi:hypothetical protein
MGLTIGVPGATEEGRARAKCLSLSRRNDHCELHDAIGDLIAHIGEISGSDRQGSFAPRCAFELR